MRIAGVAGAAAQGCTRLATFRPITEGMYTQRKQFARVVCDVVIASTLNAQDSSGRHGFRTFQTR